MTAEAAQRQPPPERTKGSARVVIGIWLTAVAAGLWCVERYGFSVNEPSPNGVAEVWPADSTLVPSEGRWTLLMFLHPKCPCTRASIHELERMLVSLRSTSTALPDLLVVAGVPPNADESWWNTDTVARVRQIDHAQVFIDRGGREAARFGAVTSGFLLLFDPSGHRRYAGGVTWARGQEGANTGCDLLAKILRGEERQRNAIPAFGCRLYLPEMNPRAEAADRSRQNGTRTASSI